MRRTHSIAAAGLALGLLLFGSACKKTESAGATAGGKEPAAAAPGQPAGAASAAPAAGLDKHSVEFEGQTITIEHSRLDLGRVDDLFDDSPATFARTENANPAILDLVFGKPRTLKGIDLTTATQDIDLNCVVTLASGGVKTFHQEYRKLSPDPTVHIDFPGLGGPVQRLRIEIGNPGGGDGHVHIRTLRFL